MKNGIITLAAGALALAGCNKRVGGPGADTNERHGHAAGYTIGRQAPLTADRVARLASSDVVQKTQYSL